MRNYKCVCNRCHSFLLMVCLVFSLFGCSGLNGQKNYEEYMARCENALEKLQTQEECHVVSTVMLGLQNGDYEENASNELWFSNQNKAKRFHNTGQGFLFYNGCWFFYQEEPVTGWTLLEDEQEYSFDRGPGIVLSDFQVISVENDGEQTLVTLEVLDDAEHIDPACGWTAVLTLDENGELRRCEHVFSVDSTDENEETTTGYFRWILEYPTFAEGEIRTYLDGMYTEATGDE